MKDKSRKKTIRNISPKRTIPSKSESRINIEKKPANPSLDVGSKLENKIPYFDRSLIDTIEPNYKSIFVSRDGIGC